MKARKTLSGILILAAALLAIKSATGEKEEYRTSLTKDGQGIVRHPAPFRFDRGALSALPSYDPKNRDSWQVDLRSYDLSGLELKGRLSDLLYASFDDKTKWPSLLPEGFNAKEFTEAGKNPGLGIRNIHKRGITGKGIGVAVIDMGFLVDHVEYKDRLRLFEEIHSADETAQMHGVATASIAVGKTVGVAPGSDLYYIACFMAKEEASESGFARDFTWAARCIDRILEINRSLPQNRKIRVISTSIGWSPQETGYQEVNDAVERARKENIFVVSTAMTQSFGFLIFGLGREPAKNPDDLASYGEAWWGGLYPHEQPGGREALILPMDSRTTASPTGPKDYVFYRLGGLSWSVPWAAGLYALACQVKPDITPEVFWAKALETGDTLMMPPRAPNMSEEEIENRVKKAIEGSMNRIKKGARGKDLEEVLGKVYSQNTGKKTDRMSEAEFRSWLAEFVRERVLLDTKPRELKKIVNPKRLIEALEKRN